MASIKRRTHKELFNQKVSNFMVALQRTKRPVEITRDEMKSALERVINTNPRCVYCRQMVTIETVSLDHMMPVSRGGRNTLGNIHFVCKLDNKAKGPLSHDEYLHLLAMIFAMETIFKNFTIRDYIVKGLATAQSSSQGAIRRAFAARS